MTEKHIQENTKSWNQFYKKSPRLRYPDLMFVNLLMRYVLNVEKISNAITIGAGDGAQPFVVAQNKIPVTCVDISEESIKRLQEFSKEDHIEQFISTKKADQRNLSDFKDNSFDLAISWSVISYLKKDEGQKAIDEIYRILKPGGHFIGLLESDDHTGYKQPGVIQIGPKTYIMPENPIQSVSKVLMTYYSENDAKDCLHAFTNLSLCHRKLELPPDLKRHVGQWMFHCKKP